LPVQVLDLLAQTLGLGDIVGIQNGDVLATRLLKRSALCRRAADVCRQEKGANTLFIVACKDRRRVIARTILDRDQFPIAKALAQQTVDAPGEIRTRIIDGHQYRDAWGPARQR
jgi:hypothetical protein